MCGARAPAHAASTCRRAPTASAERSGTAPPLLRFAACDHGSLADNEAHEFATRHALRHYASGTVYSFIPKNACTTLRYSLALANGCIAGEADFDWVHRNNATFATDLEALLTARYSFVILRCPFARLASVFLDKIVRQVPPAPRLIPLIEGLTDLGRLTFRRFAEAMADPEVRKANNHWRNQSDFLVYERYSDYFRLEAFDEAAVKIERVAGFPVRDARALSGHGLDAFTPVRTGSFAATPAAGIAQMMAQGRAPAHAALYDDESATLIAAAYADDIRLYRDLFGGRDLLFS